MTAVGPEPAPPARWHGRLPLPVALIGGFGGLVAVTVVITFLVGFGTALESTLALMRERADSAIDRMQARFARDLEPILAQARWVDAETRAGRFDPGDATVLEPFLRGLFASAPDLQVVAVVGADGMARALDRDDARLDIVPWADWPHVGRFLAETETTAGAAWAAPYWYGPTATTYVNLRTPLVRNGRYLGFLWQGVTIDDLSRGLATMTGDTDRLIPFVLYDGHWVLAHPRLPTLGVRGSTDGPLPPLAGFDDPVLAAIWGAETDHLTHLGTDSGTQVHEVERDGERHLILFRRVAAYADKPLTIGAHLDLGAAEDREIARLQRMLVSGVALFVVTVGTALLLSRAIGRPIVALTDAMDRVGRNVLDTLPPVRSNRIAELDRAGRAFTRMVEELRERQVMRRLLGTYMPETVAAAMVRSGGSIAPVATEATVLFVDIAGFTNLTEKLGADGIVALLNAWFGAATACLENRNGVITQFQGDAILAVFNVPVADPAHPARAVGAAVDLQRAARQSRFAGETLSIRVGVATGPVVAGSVGAEDRRGYTVHGDAVNLAARLEALNKTYGTGILVSESTVTRVDTTAFERIGTVTVRGQSTVTTVFTVAAD